MKTPALLLLSFVLVARAADDPEAVCRTHLRHLAGAVKAYKLVHDDKSPAKLSELYTEGLADSLSDFTCPGSGITITVAAEIDAKTDYVLGTGEILVREKAVHHGAQALGIFADATIKGVDGTPAATASATANSAQAPPPIVAPQTKPTSPPPANEPPKVTTTTALPAVTPPSKVATATTVPATSTAGQQSITLRDASGAPALPAEQLEEFIRKARASVAEPVNGVNGNGAGLEVVKSDPGISVLSTGDDFDAEGASGLGLGFEFRGDGKLVVGSVQKDSIGEEVGIKTGDAVSELNSQPAPTRAKPGAVTPEELAKLAGFAADKPLLITIQQADEKTNSFSLKLKPAAK